MTQAQVPERLRPDPFLLPQATGALFMLLIVSALASSIYVYAWAAGLFRTGFRGPVAKAMASCADVARSKVGATDPTVLTVGFHDCVVSVERHAVALVAALVVTLAIVAVVIYWVTPRFIRRTPCRPLRDFATDVAAAAAVAEIERVMAMSGRIVRVDVAILRHAVGARAYGHYPRYAIMLNLGLLVQGMREPAILRGVVAHELAHIRNRDIDIAYLAIGAWWAFIAVVVIPAAFFAAIDPSRGVDLSWRLGVLLLVLWWSRARVLRSREYYADLRVGPDVLAALSYRSAHKRGWSRALLGASLHPSEKSRRAVMEGSQRLFRLDLTAAAIAGLLLGFAYAPLSYLLSLVWTYSSFSRDWAVAAVLAVLAGAATAGSVWRATLWSVVSGSRPPSTWFCAAALTAGVLIGQSITPEVGNVGTWGTIARQQPLIAAVVAGLLLLLTQIYLRWVVLSAQAWLPAIDFPYWVTEFGTLLAAAVFGLWISAWFVIVATLYSSYPTWQTLTIAPIAALTNPAFGLSLAIVCSFVVTGWIRQRAGNLGAALLCAIGMVITFALAGVPFYGRIRQLLLIPNGPLKTLLLLGTLAIIIAAVGGLILGLVRGGRHRTGKVGALAGFSVFIAATAMLPLTILHIIEARCPQSTLLACTPNWRVVAQLSYRGLAVAGYPLLIASATTTAVIGSLIRAGLGRQPQTAHELVLRRRGWLPTLAVLLPTATAVIIIAWYGLPANLAAGRQVTYTTQQRTFLRSELAMARPGQLTWQQACTYAVHTTTSVGITDVVGTNWLWHLSATAITAASSDDAVLRAMGYTAGRSLLAGDLRRNDTDNSAIIAYCITDSYDRATSRTLGSRAARSE